MEKLAWRGRPDKADNGYVHVYMPPRQTDSAYLWGVAAAAARRAGLAALDNILTGLTKTGKQDDLYSMPCFRAFQILNPGV